MLSSQQINQKFDASLKLLTEETTTVEKFESIRKLIEGFNPKIDRHLQVVSKAITTYKKLSSGDVIELSAERLPERNEKEKRRKRALLLLIQSWNQLKNEVERVKVELGEHPQDNSLEKNTVHAVKLAKFAKGPFGIITLAAVIIVGASLFLGQSKNAPVTQSQIAPIAQEKQSTQYILFNNKKLPVNELVIRDGPDCGGGRIPHYHAKNESYATALDGTQVYDPGGCAYGKVSEVKIMSN